MNRIWKPRKLRHYPGPGAWVNSGEFLQFPTGTSYEILEANQTRNPECQRLLVWRIAPTDIPEGAVIHQSEWRK